MERESGDGVPGGETEPGSGVPDGETGVPDRETESGVPEGEIIIALSELFRAIFFYSELITVL